MNTLEMPVDRSEDLLKDAADGKLTKGALSRLLMPGPRRAFLDACAAIEAELTHQCGHSGRTCLDAGCSAEGEACLDPLLNAGESYHKAYGAEWVKIFADPANRVTYWREVD